MIYLIDGYAIEDAITTPFAADYHWLPLITTVYRWLYDYADDADFHGDWFWFNGRLTIEDVVTGPFTAD